MTGALRLLGCEQDDPGGLPGLGARPIGSPGALRALLAAL